MDPLAVLRSRGYLGLLVLAAILGVPISAAAYFFLQLVAHLQRWVFTGLPQAIGLGEPVWWPLLPAGAGRAAGRSHRPAPASRGGPSPADGFHEHGAPAARELPVCCWPPWPPWRWARCSARRDR